MPTYEEHAAEQVRRAKTNLACLKEAGALNTPEDKRVEYMDWGHRRVAYYTTEGGFERAMVRLFSNTKRFHVSDVA